MTAEPPVSSLPISRKPPLAPLLVGLFAGLLLGLAIPHPWRWDGGVFFRSGPTPVQEGAARVPGDAELEIFYAAPYQTPPQLEFPNGLGKCTVLKQTAEGFQLKNSWSFEETVTWKANGQLKK